MEDKNIYIIAYTQTDYYGSKGFVDATTYSKNVYCIQNGDWKKNGWFISYESEDDKVGTPFVPGVQYNDEGISRENDTNEYQGQDGYTCKVRWNSIKIITKEQYDQYTEIIKLYNSI
jgi:hypothetical protein